MKQITVKASKIPVSSRKIGVYLPMIKNKPVSSALNILKFQLSPTKLYLYKLIKHAQTVAKEKNISEEKMIIKNINLQSGKTLKRFRPGSKGQSYKRAKRSCQIIICIEEKE